jgi:hypothetical protein
MKIHPLCGPSAREAVEDSLKICKKKLTLLFPALHSNEMAKNQQQTQNVRKICRN